MNKTASLAVKSLVGVGSVASAAGGGVIFWKRGFSRSTEKEKVSENLENKENREEAHGNLNNQEKVENLDNSKSDKGNQMDTGELQITGNSKEAREDDKGSLKQQNDAEDLDSPEVKARREEEMVRRDERSKEWKDDQASLESEEKSWLPNACNTEDRGKSYIECSLTSGDLKKIKFKDLGDGDVTVSPKNSVNVKLKIFQLGDVKKKFLFVNDSKDNIVISKGSKNVTLKASGSTEFLREKEGLVMVKLKDYGIPETCMNSKVVFAEVKPEYKGNQNIKQCILTEGDLSKIKFHGFPEEGESKVTPLWVGEGKIGWKHNQAIILTIGNGKYGFYNVFSELIGHNQLAHRPIKITRGSVSVILEGNMESEFTVVNDSLKKEEVSELGFPKRCEMGAEERNKTCELSDNDIRRLKLKETGVSPDLLPVDVNRKMNLRIEKVTDGGYPDNKKYILSALDSAITISNTIEVEDGTKGISGYHTKTLSFGKKEERAFKNENNTLVLVN